MTMSMKFANRFSFGLWSTWAVVMGLSLSQPLMAGIQGYVTVHNSRSESVRVLVNWGFRGQVAANSSRSFLVGDDVETTTWVTVETLAAYELKRTDFSGSYTDVDVWVD
jgi:hypothetical protein